MTALGIAVAALGCTTPTAEPSSSDAAAEHPPQAVIQASADGMVLTARVESGEVEAGRDIVANVWVENLRTEPVSIQDNACQATPTWTIRSLQLPIEPLGATWDGIAGEFKDYALTQGFGAGGVPATDPVDVVVAGPCDDVEAMELELGPGTSRAWTLAWKAELVAGVPAPAGDVAYTIGIGYDPSAPPSPDADATGVRGSWVAVFKVLEVSGTLRIKGGQASLVSAGQAIDRMLSEPRFAGWLSTAPPATWSNANLILQSLSEPSGLVPAGPIWAVELFREPRSWAIGYVDVYTGAIRDLRFCNVPCDR